MLEDLDLGTDLICVLDGLDECADDSLPNLLQKIKILFTESVEKHRLSLIVLSRRHPECLERMLGSFARIDLDSDQVSNQSDINSYITSRVAQLAERKGISTSLVKHIEETFREKSQDTFLWVSFMADDLEKQTVPGIEKALQTLPKGLDETYERILLSIKPDNIAIIATMLKWISLAMFPLTVPQLAEAMRIHASGYLSREEICLSYIESCGHLLQLSRLSDADEESNEAFYTKGPRVTFVHQSVKDFLFGPARHHAISDFQVNKAQGDFDIACQLLSSMQNEWLKCVEDQLPWAGFKEIDGYYLARYAQSNWDLHLKQLQDKSLWQLIDRNPLFFSDVSAIRDKWRHASDKVDIDAEAINLLQFACEFGLVALAKKLLKRRKLTSPFTFQRYVNQLSCRSSLSLAIDSGNTELIQLLLSYKANIEGRCTSWSNESALQYATKQGHVEILQLFAGTKIGQRIIDEDIRATKRGIRRDSLLHLAASSGNSRMCSFLLERYHYNIDVVGAGGQTPVCDAIRENSIGLARILVNQWGASTAAADKILKAVVKSRKYFGVKGSGEELEFVISELKIDINARDECGQTILHFAFERMALVWYSSETCYAFAARCLVLGADPSLRSTNGDTPFHLYRWFESPRIAPFRPIVLLLRDGRLGVNDHGNRGNTLLHNFVNDAFDRYGASPRNDIFNGLTSLLDVGADRTLVNSHGMTALQLSKKLCDDFTDEERGSIIETHADIVDVLENFATVSNQPQRLDPLDWPIEREKEEDV
jgi:ankyrin repeat protein